MLPPLGPPRPQHRFGHIDQHRHVIKRCQIRPRCLPQQQVIPLRHDNPGFSGDHPGTGADNFNTAVKHRHRHERLIPGAQAWQLPDKPPQDPVVIEVKPLLTPERTIYSGPFSDQG